MDRCTGGGNADDGGSYKCPDLDSKGSCAMESTGGVFPVPREPDKRDCSDDGRDDDRSL